MGDLFPVVVAITIFPEQRFQLLHGIVVCGVQRKQITHHGCLFFLNDQPAIVLGIAENAAVAQHDTLFDGLLMSKLYPGGQLAQLVLRDGRHNGQTKL